MDLVGPIRAAQQPNSARVYRLLQERAQARGPDGLAGCFDVVVLFRPTKEGTFTPVSSSWFVEVDADSQAAERMGMRMSEVVETVSKKPIAPWTKNLLVEVMVNDENDEDVEVSLAHQSELTPKLTSYQVPYCLVHI